LARVNDWGASELPLSSAEMDQYGETLLHIPHVVGTISIFHSVPNTKVNLTATLLAKIFQRDITTWDHADIKAKNPNLNVPAGQNINVVHRVKGSSSTDITTAYLEIAARNDWTLGSGSTVAWPEDTQGCEGSAGVSACITSTPYSIGYIDTDHGTKDGLTEIELQNKDGVYLSAVESDKLAAVRNAALPASTGNWEAVKAALIDQRGPNTWPMCAFSYMIVPQDLTRMGQKGHLLKAYLEYVIGTTGQDFVTKFGFLPVPENLADINKAGVATLKLDSSYDSYSWEWSTDAIAGAQSNVFSVKRRQYSDYKIEEIEKALALLTAQNADLKAKVDQLMSGTVVPPAPVGSCAGICDEKSPDGCYCDALCMDQNPSDCCPDFVSECPAIAAQKPCFVTGNC